MPESQLSKPISLDAMGGDSAPDCVLEGAQLALIRHPNVKFLIFGDEAKVAPYLTKYPKLKAASELIHTNVRVSADDKPSVAIRQGKQSSMRLAIDSVADGRAAAVVSAGNTGALMAMSKIVLKTLPGINRPAIAALFPTIKGDCIMLDLGANVECSAKDLFHFAIMGDAFAKAVLGLKRPKIGLLNIGSEELKGHEEIKDAAQMIRESNLDIDYYGFVEGNVVPEGVVDVVVTDGFTGNVALKTAEGTARLIKTYMRDAFQATLMSKIGALLLKKALTSVKDRLDERKRNGAMFLGLNGIAVKSHGSADAVSFANAISVAIDLAANDVNKKILSELQLYDEQHPEGAADPYE
jgi:glycerol-3-phosphate acyltransferase PlsX